MPTRTSTWILQVSTLWIFLYTYRVQSTPIPPRCGGAQADQMYVLPDSTCILVNRTGATWADAQVACQLHNGHLLYTRNGGDMELVKQLMSNQSLGYVWLGGKERFAAEWHWQDGLQMDGGFQSWAVRENVASGRAHCVGMDAAHGYNWLESPCAFPYGYICQLDRRSTTCASAGEDVSVMSTGYCYVMVQKEMSWFRAREECAISGGLLATIYTKTLHDELVSRMQAKGHHGYWTGLRNTQWRWTNGEEMYPTFWESNQPSNVGSCVTVYKFSGSDFLWTNVNCDQEKPYICQQDPPKSTTTAPPTPLAEVPSSATPAPNDTISDGSTGKNHIGLTVGLLVGAFLLFMILVAVVCVFACYIRAGKNLKAKGRADAAMRAVQQSSQHRSVYDNDAMGFSNINQNATPDYDIFGTAPATATRPKQKVTQALPDALLKTPEKKNDVIVAKNAVYESSTVVPHLAASGTTHNNKEENEIDSGRLSDTGSTMSESGEEVEVGEGNAFFTASSCKYDPEFGSNMQNTHQLDGEDDKAKKRHHRRRHKKKHRRHKHKSSRHAPSSDTERLDQAFSGNSSTAEGEGPSPKHTCQNVSERPNDKSARSDHGSVIVPPLNLSDGEPTPRMSAKTEQSPTERDLEDERLTYQNDKTDSSHHGKLPPLDLRRDDTPKQQKQKHRSHHHGDKERRNRRHSVSGPDDDSNHGNNDINKGEGQTAPKHHRRHSLSVMASDDDDAMSMSMPQQEITRALAGLTADDYRPATMRSRSNSLSGMAGQIKVSSSGHGRESRKHSHRHRSNSTSDILDRDSVSPPRQSISTPHSNRERRGSISGRHHSEKDDSPKHGESSSRSHHHGSDSPTKHRDTNPDYQNISGISASKDNNGDSHQKDKKDSESNRERSHHHHKKHKSKHRSGDKSKHDKHSNGEVGNKRGPVGASSEWDSETEDDDDNGGDATFVISSLDSVLSQYT